MGKKKAKAAQGRFPDYTRKGFKKDFSAFVRQTCPGWGDEARNLVKEIDEAREDGPRDGHAKPKLAAFCRLGDLEESDFERKRWLFHTFGKVALPSLMDEWERMPKVVRVSQGAMDEAARLGGVELARETVEQAFPAAIFFDLSPVVGGRGDVSGLFAWSQASEQFGGFVRTCLFPKPLAGTVVESIGDGEGEGEFQRKLALEDLRARSLLEQTVLSMPKKTASFSSCYDAYALDASPEDAWARLESFVPDDDGARFDFETGDVSYPAALEQDRPGSMWPNVWGDEQLVDGLDVTVKRLLIAAYQGVCDAEIVREGDVEVRIVRSREEARKIKEAARAAEKVQEAHEGRIGAVKSLAAARAEIAALRRELARLSCGTEGDDALSPSSSACESEGEAGDGERLGGELDALRFGLEQTVGRWESEREELESQLAQSKAEAERQKERADAEQGRADALASRAALVDSLELPLTCAGAAELAGRAWPDRLLLLPSATRSAGEYNPKRADEVFDALRAMALHLHPLVFSADSVDVTRAFRARSGFEVAMRDVRQVRKSPQLRRARTFSYEGKRVEMIPHVKGQSNKQGEALRIHFCLDHEKKLIVIGHCGEHLSGELSPR